MSMQTESKRISFLNEEERAETIWACRFCMMCHVADRVTRVIKRESYSPRGRSAILAAVEKGFLGWNEDVADIMYTTLNDGLLREWCVGNYDHEEMVVDARSRIMENGLAPEDVKDYVKTLRSSGGLSADPRPILADANVRLTEGAKVLLFAGCTARDSEKDTLIAAGRLFNHAGIEFQMLGKEPCCGWPLYQLGDLAGAGEFSIRLAEQIRKSGATSVVALDGDCYRMLQTRTARFGGDLKGVKALHITQVAADWITAGRIQIRNRLQDRVTYHDPCSLARYCDDTDSARSVLNAVLAHGVIEIRENRKLSHCCGAGGMLYIHRPDVSNAVSLLRLEDASSTGASMLATACTRCDQTFRKALASSGKGGIQVVNIITLLGKALELS